MKYFKTRSGCQDLWNAFMVEGAIFSNNDIPFCPTTTKTIPTKLISYVTAKQIYKKEINSGNALFRYNAFVHFCIDDQKFDSCVSGIWQNPKNALEILKHFSGVITPDFSTYADFPDPIKRWNTYRMRAFGFWISNNNIPIINNARWGDKETWEYCFDGLPEDSVLFIGTIASGLKEPLNRKIFDDGLIELVNRLHPHTLIVYGSSKNPIFDELRKSGIKIISFQSDTNIAFERRNSL